jgi:sulfur-carrier protein
VTLRYWASLRAAAGRTEEVVDAATLAEALASARLSHAGQPRFAQVLDVCSVVVDGSPTGRREHAAIPLRDGSVVELLPPFAGGS